MKKTEQCPVIEGKVQGNPQKDCFCNELSNEWGEGATGSQTFMYREEQWNECSRSRNSWCKGPEAELV